MSKRATDIHRIHDGARDKAWRQPGLSRWICALIIFSLQFFAVAPRSPGQSKPRARKQTLAFTHVTVIDATGAPPMDDMTVLIEGDRITALGKARTVTVPDGARIVDAKGKFLIPGLWDMHAHLTYSHFLKLNIANGVTGVREMGGSPAEFEALRVLRKRIADGQLVGPRIVAAGVVVDGPRETSRPDSLQVTNDTEAREAVDSLKQMGADFVKVYSMLQRDGYFAVAAEAKHQSLAFGGHVPASVSAAEASDAGQKSLEHLFGVLAGCSSIEAQLTAESKAAAERSGIAGFVTAEIGAQLKALERYDDQTAASLFARFVRNGTWQVPTLTGWRNLSAADDVQLINDPRSRYIPAERRQAWKSQREGLRKSLPAEFFKARLIEKQFEVVLAMQKAGVGIMTGTDSAGLYLYPGFSLHEELALLVKAGLTPMEALQAATRNPAKYLGLLDRSGTVEKDRLADLVLLDANPLVEISNTQKIAAVMLAGKLITKPELDQLLSEAQAEANSADRSASIRKPSEAMIALVGATLIDGNGRAPVSDAVVIVKGDRIIRVGRRNTVRYPRTAKVIDLKGKFLVPGLIDLHVHYSGWMGELFLAHGVTTVKDMGNDVEWISTISGEMKRDEARGPRIFYVGNAIDSPPPERDHHIGLDDPATARRAVTLLRDRGASAIKVREKASPEIIRAVTGQAHKLGLIVTGHVGHTNARDAALAGIDGLEHASGIVEATADGPRPPKPAGEGLEKATWEIKSYALINPAKAAELVKFLASRKVALIPTMSNWWRMATDRREAFAQEDAEYARNPLLSYVPEQIRQIWTTSVLFKVQDISDQAQIDLGYRKVQDLLIKQYKAGGRVLAGTDTLVSIPGLSLLREMMFLVDAGLTPADVISIATRDNAGFLGKGKDLGTISVGKLADLVVLSANPLEDIGNFRRVAMVMKGGRMVDTTYHRDYSTPTPKPKLSRPLWIERQLRLDSGKAARR